jgi:hypothetical protein
MLFKSLGPKAKRGVKSMAFAQSPRTFWDGIASKVANNVLGSGPWWWQLSQDEKTREYDNDSEHRWIDYTVMTVGSTPVMVFKTTDLVQRFDPAEYVLNLKTLRPTKNSYERKELSQELKNELKQILPPANGQFCL